MVGILLRRHLCTFANCYLVLCVFFQLITIDFNWIFMRAIPRLSIPTAINIDIARHQKISSAAAAFPFSFIRVHLPFSAVETFKRC